VKLTAAPAALNASSISKLSVAAAAAAAAAYIGDSADVIVVVVVLVVLLVMLLSSSLPKQRMHVQVRAVHCCDVLLLLLLLLRYISAVRCLLSLALEELLPGTCMGPCKAA
jgi:hypothetical protein